jgi:hypothetical protein
MKLFIRSNASSSRAAETAPAILAAIAIAQRMIACPT